MVTNRLVSKATAEVRREIASEKNRNQRREVARLTKKKNLKNEILGLIKCVSNNFQSMVASNQEVKKLIDKLFFNYYFDGRVEPSHFVELFEVGVTHCQFSSFYYLTLEKDLMIDFRAGIDSSDHQISRDVLDEEDALPEIKKILTKLCTPKGAIRYILKEWEHSHIYFPEK